MALDLHRSPCPYQFCQLFEDLAGLSTLFGVHNIFVSLQEAHINNIFPLGPGVDSWLSFFDGGQSFDGFIGSWGPDDEERILMVLIHVVSYLL